VVEKPDITCRETAGVHVSYCGTSWITDHTGLSLKKPRASEQDRADVARAAAAMGGAAGKVCAARLIFIDETWAKTNMTRMHGRCARGQRKTRTFVAGLRCDGITAPCILDGPINAECFLAWAVQFLVQILRVSDIMVMDNLSSHKDTAIRRAIRAGGAKLFHRPTVPT
jgi:hypothetical protein